MKLSVRIVWALAILVAGCATAPSPRNESSLGDAALAQGDYRGALAHYSQAGDAAGLDRLAHEMLARHDYDGFLACRQQAGKTVVIQDTFRDNARNWNVRNDDYGKSSISGGKLLFEKTRDDGVSFVWTEAKLDPERDFLVEATFTKVSGEDNNAISIAWGVKNAEANYVFGYSGDGHYRYTKWSGGTSSARISWTESAAVKKGNATNTIAVSKTGDTLSFIINGAVVGTGRFESLQGSNVGIALSPKVAVEVSSFRVEQYPSARGPWNEIAIAAMQSSDFPTALKYYFQAGAADDLRAAFVKCVASGGRELARQALKDEALSDKAARIRIASFLCAAGLRADAVAELKRAGWDIASSLVFPLADEKFQDNSRDWSLDSDEDTTSSISNGKFTIETRKGLSTWNFFDLSPDADYRIDAKMRRTSGDDTQFNSLIWGFQKTSDTDELGVDAAGNFFYGFTKNGSWNGVIPTTASPAVRKGTAENTLTVVRTGDTTTFYVNGTAVGHAAAREPLGKGIGFSLGKLAVEISQLRVVELAPQFAQDLARAEVPGANPAALARLTAQLQAEETPEAQGAAAPASALISRAAAAPQAGKLAPALQPAAASAGAPSDAPAVVLCGQSTGTGVTLLQVFDPAGSGMLGGNGDLVLLDNAGTEISLAYFFDGGEFGVVLPEEGPNGHEATMYGAYQYKVSDSGFRLPVFTRKGNGEKGFVLDGDSIWLFDGDTREMIAKMAYQDVTGLDGQPDKLQMVKLLKGSHRKWIGDSGGRIVELQLNGALKQIGWVSWREVTNPDGGHLALLMTRSMNPDSKWTGSYNGKVYREK